MKKLFFLAIAATAFAACKQSDKANGTDADKKFASMCETYYQDGLKLSPISATYIGDERYNDLLPNDGSQAYIASNKSFNERYLDSLKLYDRESLDRNNKLSFDYMKDQIDMNLEGFKYHTEYFPFNQMFALPLTFGQLGSGTGAQPFKTIKNYDDWLKRANAFAVWADTAIGNFKKGASAGYVLPKALVSKMIPQMQSMVVAKPEQSLFYGPVKLIPASFSPTEKQKITADYRKAIMEVIIPTYKKLGDYLKDEYLPKARSTSGYSALPGGAEWYAYLVRQQTTTNKTPEEIYQTGLKEVARIKGEMDSIKNLVGFKGDLKAFFEYMKTDKKFMPYKTPQEILAAFEDIHQRMKPNLKKMFEKEPKTPFEIRQTEAFRAASASAEYNQGSADG
ncbi:MAG: DUF885 domain-containing protein, partial [Sphingobacteriales bacterium]